MRRILIAIFLSVVGILQTGCFVCDNGHWNVVVTNNSDKDIYVLYKFENQKPYGPGLANLRYEEGALRCLILVGDTNAYAVMDNHSCIESGMDYYGGGVLIFVYDVYAVDHSRPELLDQVPYETYCYTLQDLENFQWRLTYPDDMVGYESDYK